MNWAKQKLPTWKKNLNTSMVSGSWCSDMIHWQGFGSTPLSLHLSDLLRHRIAFRSRWRRINRHHTEIKKKNIGERGTLNLRTIQIYLLFSSALARGHRRRGGSALPCYRNCIFHAAWLQYNTLPPCKVPQQLTTFYYKTDLLNTTGVVKSGMKMSKA